MTRPEIIAAGHSAMIAYQGDSAGYPLKKQHIYAAFWQPYTSFLLLV